MIDEFDKENAFLSNFFDSPFTIDGISYPSVEHFFQAQKTTNLVERKSIAKQTTPGRAKRAGRAVKIRLDWEEIKLDIMLKGLRIKFSDPELAQKLINTGTEKLEEGNWWHDNFWGNCHCAKCQNIQGKNHLGKLLEQVRQEIQE